MATSCTLLHPLDKYQAGEADGATPPTDDATLDAADAPADAGPSWKRYTYGLLVQAWQTPVSLSEIWTDPNAPPPRGIGVVLDLVDENRLLVFADDGKFYLQADGHWRPPVPVAQAWTPMKTAPLSGFDVPHTFAVTTNATAPNEEALTFADNPIYFSFRYLPNDTIVFSATGTIPDEDGGPKQDGRKSVWSYPVVDLTAPPEERWRCYTLYDDGIIYELHADLTWRSYPIAESPLWKDKPNAPPTTGLRAAYFDYATSTVSFLGP